MLHDDPNAPPTNPSDQERPVISAYPVYDPETEGVVYRVVPTQHTESISEIVSEPESDASAMTIWSDDVHDYYVTQHGRQYPASENAVRWFPMDDTRRETLSHTAQKYLYGHNYAGPIKEMLSPDPGVGKQRHVLEIGTRGGMWVQEMATEFPHVQFQSLDIAPFVPHLPRTNIVFEVYDITEGLLLEDNSQDIVFVNMGIQLVKDYRALLLEIHRVLRPGGLVHLREAGPGIWDPEDQFKPARLTNPIGCHCVDLTRDAMKKHGADPDICEKLGHWLSPESETWKDSSCPRGFERIHTEIKTPRVYPHAGYPCAADMDPHMVSLLGHVHVMLMRDSAGLLCDVGLEAKEASLLIEAMIEELKDPERCPSFKLYTVYATKPRNDVC